MSTRAATIVQILAGPAPVLDLRKDLARFSLPLPCERSLEQLHTLSRVAHGPPLGHDPDHISSGLEHDLGTGLDRIAIRDGLGDRDLQLARDP